LIISAVFCLKPNVHISQTDSRVTITLENLGDKPFKFFSRNTPFEVPLGTNLFDIRSASNLSKKLLYLGNVAFRHDDIHESELRVVLPNENLTVTVDLADYYHFHEEGAHVLTLGTQPYSDEKKTFEVNVAKSHVYQSQIKYSSLMAMPMAGYLNCNANDVKFINSAVDFAKKIATRVAGLLANNSFRTQAWTYYLGQFTAARLAVVKNKVFVPIRDHLNNKQFSADCYSTAPGSFCNIPGNYYGWATFADPTFTVHFCRRWLIGDWPRPPSRGVIHELSHFDPLGACRDYVYDEGPCNNLALKNPDQAINCAECISFFAMKA